MSSSASYTAAYESLALYRVRNPGYLRFSGETHVDYLQRQTTNDLGLLSPTRAVTSILTSATGHILEAFTLIQVGDAIGLLTQPGHGPGLAAYFKKRIFFNDRVNVEDLSEQFSQIELHGPQALNGLQTLGFPSTPGIGEISTTQLNGEILRVIGQEGFAGPIRFILVIPKSVEDQVTNQLAAQNVTPLDFQTHDILRIEASRPGDPEFADAAYTPFELGLDKYVSTEKGCYTGQEVLARQVTYDKIVRNLVRIRSQEPTEAGGKVHSQSKEIGAITSAVVSPKIGPIALAVVKKPFDKPETEVEISTAKGKIAATVG